MDLVLTQLGVSFLDLSPAAKHFLKLVFLLYLVSELCIITGLMMLLCSAFGRRKEEMMCLVGAQGC